MGEPVTFLCDGCQATLTVPAELAGISGPCPYCGVVIASPELPARRTAVAAVVREVNTVAATHAPIVPLALPVPVPVGAAPRPWLTAQLVAQNSASSRRGRKIHPALWVAAGAAFFAGVVTVVWKMWDHPADSKSGGQPLAAESYVPPPPGPRPAVLATADEPPEPGEGADMPPPSDTKPAVMAPPTVVARDVSTGASTNGAPVPAPAVPPAAQNENEAMRAIRKAVPLGGPLAKPGEAIIRFMGAATWQERLPFTLAPEKMKPLMEAYYRKAKDGPVIPEEVQFTCLEPTEGNPALSYYSYIVYLPDRPAGIPLSVEDTPQGTRVEWRTFIESKDYLLARFCKDHAEESGTFRVFIRRCHYFEKDVPEQDKKQCFQVSSPDATGEFYVWADQDSQVYRKYFASGERARWDVSSRMTLALEWQKAASGATWVRLRDVVAESWHPDLLPAGAK